MKSAIRAMTANDEQVRNRLGSDDLPKLLRRRNEAQVDASAPGLQYRSHGNRLKAGIRQHADQYGGAVVLHRLRLRAATASYRWQSTRWSFTSPQACMKA